ncbi:MAG: hypothetical protein FJ213_12730 [Ignavibacteria bacterium]|nr:hypothetical protein [Ignavibacteria bacterium]
MVRTKKEKPASELAIIDESTGWTLKYEYQIKPVFEFDEILKKNFFIIELLTYREFASFRYVIDYILSNQNREYKIKIKGLNSKDISFPYAGKASVRIKLPSLIGLYTFHIIKKNGETNSFDLKINSYERSVILEREFLKDNKKHKKFVEYIG